MKQEIDLKLIDKSIINYCYKVYGYIDKRFLKDNKIRSNLLLEVMYAFCTQKYNDTGNFKITENEINNLFNYSRNMDMIIQEYIDGKTQLEFIDNDGNYNFIRMKQIN